MSVNEFFTKKFSKRYPAFRFAPAGLLEMIIMRQIILITLVLLSFSSIAFAYNSESGLEDNETFHADYSLWLGDINERYYMSWYTQTADNVYVYRPNSPGLACLGVFSWTSWIITSFLTPDSNIEIWTSWKVQGKTFNEDTQTYEDKGTEYVSGYLMEVAGGSTETKSCKKNIVEAYFMNDTSRADDFKGYNEFSTNPDYVEIEMRVGEGLADIDHTETYGVTMTQDQATGLSQGSLQPDYGFGGGVGGAGGSGELYGSVGLNLGDAETGAADTFKIIFYCLIPFIFIIAVFKMIGKVTRDG